MAKVDPKNGKLDKSTLYEFGHGRHSLIEEAAIRYVQMKRAALADGIEWSETDSYRSYEQQVDLKKRKPKLAAKPGTSEHGYGKALDLATPDLSEGLGKNSEQYKWLVKNAGRFGFHTLTSKVEPWHWEYRGDPTEEIDQDTITALNDYNPKKTPLKLNEGRVIKGPPADIPTAVASEVDLTDIAPTPMPSRGVPLPQAPSMMPGRPAGIDAKTAPTPMPGRPQSLMPMLEIPPVPRARPKESGNTGTAATPEDAMYGVRLPPESSPSKEQGKEAQVYDEDVWNNLGFGTGLAISAEQDKLLAASAKASDSAQTKVTESKTKASNSKSWSTFPEIEIASQTGLDDGGFGDKKSYTENLVKQVAPKPIETAVRKVQTIRQRADGTQTTTQAAGTQESSPQGTPQSVIDARKANSALNPAVAAPTIDETRAEQDQMRNRISPAAGAVLPELAIPQAPTPMPGRPPELSQKGTAPAPMPGRPAGIDKSTAPVASVKKSAPSAESEIEVTPPKQAEETVQLRNGKIARLGTYKNENTGNTITVTKGEDGFGHIEVQRKGLIDLGSEMNAPTIVGAIIRAKVNEAVQAGTESVAQNLVPTVQNAATNAIEAVAPITEGIGGAFNNIMGMFGGGDKDPKTLDEAVDARNNEIAANPVTQIEVIPPQGPQGRGHGGSGNTTTMDNTGTGKEFTTTNTGQTIRAGQTVQLSGGRTGVVQEDGSIIDNNGRRSKGSSGQ